MQFPSTFTPEQNQILDSMATDARAGGWRLSVDYLRECIRPHFLNNYAAPYFALTYFMKERCFTVTVQHDHGRTWKFDNMLRSDTVGYVKERLVLQTEWMNNTQLCIRRRGRSSMQADTMTLGALIRTMGASKNLNLFTDRYGLPDVEPSEPSETDEEDATEIA